MNTPRTPARTQNPTVRDLRRRRVHQSLIRTPLYAGVDKGFLLVEGCTVGFLFFAVGFHLATLFAAGVWVLVLHPLMVWINAKDPLLATLYVRSLWGRDYYVPHAPGESPGGEAVDPETLSMVREQDLAVNT